MAFLESLDPLKKALDFIEEDFERLKEFQASVESKEIEKDIYTIQEAFSHMKDQVIALRLKGRELEDEDETFFVSLRHEFRACVTTIKGFGELILESMGNYTTVKGSQLIQIMDALLSKSDRLLPLINALQGKKTEQEEIQDDTTYPSCYVGALVSKGVILMIDDAQEKHKLVKHHLSHTPFQVISAYDGRSGLDMIPDIHPDVIILDLMMPHMNGFEVLNQLKSQPQTCDIPVIIVSNLSEDAPIVQCLRSGADDYLTMPLNPVILLSRVSSCLQKKSLRDREKKILKDLEQSRVRLKHALETMSDGVALFDEKDQMILVNRAFSKIYGIEADRGQGMTYHDFLDWNTRHNFYDFSYDFSSLASGELPTAHELVEWRKNCVKEFRKGLFKTLFPSTTGRWLEVVGSPVEGGGTVTVHKDVTRRVLEEKEIRHLACHDPLTGLANRLFLEDSASKAFQRAKEKGEQVYLFFFDLDGFKKVNDTRGHDAGDMVLKDVAQCLKDVFRKDDVVARLGGDEFCALTQGIDEAIAEKLASRCLEAFAQNRLTHENLREIGVSIGVACFPLHGVHPKDVLEKADAAMYMAKNKGKGTYVMASFDALADFHSHA